MNHSFRKSETHTHYWILDATHINGETLGVCKGCHERKTFHTPMDRPYSEYGSARGSFYPTFTERGYRALVFGGRASGREIYLADEDGR